jgi:hypothetical protein
VTTYEINGSKLSIKINHDNSSACKKTLLTAMPMETVFYPYLKYGELPTLSTKGCDNLVLPW